MKKRIVINKIVIGGTAPISIQSMTNTKTSEYEATELQMLSLYEAGADLVRISAPDEKSVHNVAKLQQNTDKPLCADIHFNHNLAILSAEKGIAKVRINPGNLGNTENYIKVLKACKSKNTAIRIGVNAGSIDMKYKNLNIVDAMFKSIEEYVHIAEKENFHKLVLSAKSSDVLETIEINRKISASFPYPIHIGVTEAGTKDTSLAKSYSALGILLNEGIGNTIRISISGDPVEEIISAKKLLSALHLRETREVIACPTCSRTNVQDMPKYAKFTEDLLEKYDINISFAVMGCNVNGPGEASRADAGVIFGPKNFTLMQNGEIIGTYPHENYKAIVEDLIKKMK